MIYLITFNRKGGWKLTRVITQKNTLIVQGRLLCDKPQDALMTIAEWFSLYEQLKDELQGEQERIVGSLAQRLMAIQIASQLHASNAATAKES